MTVQVEMMVQTITIEPRIHSELSMRAGVIARGIDYHGGRFCLEAVPTPATSLPTAGRG